MVLQENPLYETIPILCYWYWDPPCGKHSSVCYEVHKRFSCLEQKEGLPKMINKSILLWKDSQMAHFLSKYDTSFIWKWLVMSVFSRMTVATYRGTALTTLLFSPELKPHGYYLDHFWQADLGHIGQAMIGVKVPNSSHMACIQHGRGFSNFINMQLLCIEK